MKSVAVCGQKFSGFDKMFTLLTQCGLEREVPGKGHQITMDEFHTSLLEIFELDPEGSSYEEQLRPSIFLQQLASSIFANNLGKTIWGWANEHTVRFLDFWAELDDCINFVLTYISPEQLASRLAKGHLPVSNLGATLANWTSCNRKMLRFYHKHSARCLLVNANESMRRPSIFGNLAANFLRLPLPLPELGLDNSASCLIDPPAAQFAQIIARNFPDISYTFSELQDSADLPETMLPETNIEEAWTSYVTLAKNNQSMSSQLNIAQQEIIQLNKTLGKLEHSIVNKNEQIRKLEQVKEQLTLIGQELERYCIDYHTAQDKFNRCETNRQYLLGSWLHHQPNQLHFDLREEITGENWYPAEHDGRWAGPGTQSLLRLPPLRAGNYVIHFDIVGAISTEILMSMKVSWQGATLSLTEIPSDVDATYESHFTVGEEEIENNDLLFSFSSSSTPAAVGHNPDDHRPLTVRFQSIRLAYVH